MEVEIGARRAEDSVAGRSRRLAVRLAPWGFPVIYLGWAYAWWAPLFGSEGSVWAGSNLLLFLIGGASPLLAGVLLAWLTGGRARVVDLGVRLVDWRRISPSWWPILLGYWLVFDLVMALAAVVLGVTERPLDIALDVLADPAGLGFLVLLSFVFPAVEEVGLRGYWLDRLQERFRPAVAGLVNGATWAAWHSAFVFLPGYYEETTFDPQLGWWLPMIVCETLLFVWVYNRTGRSILAVLLLHGMMNLTGEVLGITPAMYPFVLVGHLAVAAAVVAAMSSGSTGQRPRRPATTDDGRRVM